MARKKLISHTQLDVYRKALDLYVKRDDAATIYQAYDEVLRMLVAMISHPENWTL